MSLKPIDWTKPIRHTKGRLAKYIGEQTERDDGTPITDAFKHLCLVGTTFNYYDEFGRVRGKNGHPASLMLSNEIAPQIQPASADEAAEFAATLEAEGKAFRQFLHGKFDGASKDAAKIVASLDALKAEISSGFLMLAELLDGKKPQAPAQAPKAEPAKPEQSDIKRPVAVLRGGGLKQLESVVGAAPIKNIELFNAEPVVTALRTLAICAGVRKMTVSTEFERTAANHRRGSIKLVSGIVGGFKARAYGEVVSRDVYVYCDETAQAAVRQAIKGLEK